MKSFRLFTIIGALALGLLSAGAAAAGVLPPDVGVALMALAFIGDTAIFNPTELKAALDKISDQVKEVGEKAIAEAKGAKGVADKTKETADELLTKQGELQGRLQALEQSLDARIKTAAAGGVTAYSPGAEVVGSAGYKAYIEERNFKKGFSMPVKAIATITSNTTGDGGAGDLIAPDRQTGINPMQVRRLTVRDLLTPGRTNSNLIQYVKETGFQNAAATVAEGAAKPKSDLIFDLVATAVVKIATYVKASTEILADAPMLQSYVDGRLRYMLGYVEETQLLNGSGVGNNLNGIYTQATPFVSQFAMTGFTRIDVLRQAMLMSELALFPATGIVLHPTDWAAIELTKDSTGAYIFANPQSLLQPSLWGRPIVATPAMTVDTFLTGAFRLGAQVFDRQQSAIQVATENEDDFIKNIVTILAEERLGLAVYRPEAFIKGDITPATLP